MSWITVIEEKDSSGELKKIYDEIKKKRGKLSNIMKVHSLNPKAMERHMQLYLSIMFSSSRLSRADRELIAVVVSSINTCDYCIKHHAEALNFYWKDQQKINNLIKDYKSVDISDKTADMLDYVVKLTRKPNDINKSDIKKLREACFSDEDILNINLITSYFNFVNRIALGLGVDFSEDEIKGYTY